VFSREAALAVISRRILVVSPATARENNGNWQTASRWARFLRAAYTVDVAPGWPGSDAPDLLVALHARRSAASVAAFAQAHPERPIVLVLTGTDLYRDLATSHEAQTALAQATALVLLQPAGLAQLPEALRPKARVIYQSAPALRPRPRRAAPRHLDICMIGHLRPEKDPLTFMRAAALVRDERLRFVHVGAALDPALEEAAHAAQQANPRYRWLGALPHAQARQRLKRCHAMAIASTMEGGANVIIEAVTAGVPVLASGVSGNRGMLGDDYAGYFPVGDAQALAHLAERSVADRDFDALLRRHCAARAILFAPAAEQAALLGLMADLLPRFPSRQPVSGVLAADSALTRG
jgi:putative glycosyltransferase (TIGR04348 family)